MLDPSLEWMLASMFGPSNPVFFAARHRDGAQGACATQIGEFLRNRDIAGNTGLLGNVWPEEWGPMPRASVPRHVIPVFSGYARAGWMVPLRCTPAQDWRVSDAFGRMGMSSGVEPSRALGQLLEWLENAIERELGRRPPLRWRSPLEIHVACPVHIEAIAGTSLQLPLLLGLLRELTSIPAGPGRAAQTAFGTGPLFATGEMNWQTGEIVEVDHVSEKLEGFLREYGDGLPAVLLPIQLEEVKRAGLGHRVEPHVVSNVAEMLRLPQWKAGIEHACRPPHITEIDSFLELVSKLHRSVRFGDGKSVCLWMREAVQDGYYRYRIDSEIGMCELHAGNFEGAWRYLETVRRAVEENASFLGADDRANSLARIGSTLLDLGEARCGLEFLNLAPPLGQCTIAARVRLSGARSQLFRAMGDYDQAVTAGEAAVEWAKAGLARDTGQDMNYLIHALLRRKAEGDWDRAERLLAESKTEWAPPDRPATHLTFCLHYEAELARLRGVPFDPPAAPYTSGIWSHAYAFALLACGRNRAHSVAERIAFLERALAFPAGRDVLFQLFAIVYRMHRAVLAGDTVGGLVDQAVEWCRLRAETGAPGWERALGPWLQQATPTEAWVEGLTQRIPYF